MATNKDEEKMYEVYDRVMNVMPGQGDISIEWYYLCKEVNSSENKYVYVIEGKSWGYCSPNISELDSKIRRGEERYFYPRVVDAVELTKNPVSKIAVVPLPISVNLIKGGYVGSLECRQVEYRECRRLIGAIRS